MELKKLKEKVATLSTSLKESSSSALNYSKTKLAASRFTLNTMDEVEAFIDKSMSTDFIEKKTGKTKTFQHKIIIIFLDIESDFFSQMLYQLPLLVTKAFSQNITLKLADIHMPGLHKAAYNIKGGPSLVLIENKKIIKNLEGEENIQKVVKTLDLDINKTIATL